MGLLAHCRLSRTWDVVTERSGRRHKLQVPKDTILWIGRLCCLNDGYRTSSLDKVHSPSINLQPRTRIHSPSINMWPRTRSTRQA